MMPAAESCAMGVWLSMPPGSTSLPLASMSVAPFGKPYDFAVAKDSRTFPDLLTPKGLAEVKTYADGIGPNKAMVIPRTLIGNLGEATALVADAHAVGLKVHPWTFRRENFFLPLAQKSSVNPAAHGDVVTEIRFFIAAGVDGFFSDNVAEAYSARAEP